MAAAVAAEAAAAAEVQQPVSAHVVSSLFTLLLHCLGYVVFSLKRLKISIDVVGMIGRERIRDAVLSYIAPVPGSGS